MNSEQEDVDGLSTSHNARILECDVCQDVVVPSHNETYKEMNGTACAVCDNGVLKAERRDMVRRKDVAQLIQDKIDELESIIEESAHSRYELGNSYSLGGIETLEELLDEVLVIAAIGVALSKTVYCLNPEMSQWVKQD